MAAAKGAQAMPFSSNVPPGSANGPKRKRTAANGAAGAAAAGGRRTSRFTGVNWHKGSSRWSVGISAMGKRRFVGYFKEEEEAARAYDTEARKAAAAKAAAAAVGGEVGKGPGGRKARAPKALAVNFPRPGSNEKQAHKMHWARARADTRGGGKKKPRAPQPPRAKKPKKAKAPKPKAAGKAKAVKGAAGAPGGAAAMLASAAPHRPVHHPMRQVTV